METLFEKTLRALVLVTQILGLLLVGAEIIIYTTKAIRALVDLSPTLDGEVLRLLGWVFLLSLGEKLCRKGATPFYDK